MTPTLRLRKISSLENQYCFFMKDNECWPAFIVDEQFIVAHFRQDFDKRTECPAVVPATLQCIWIDEEELELLTSDFAVMMEESVPAQSMQRKAWVQTLGAMTEGQGGRFWSKKVQKMNQFFAGQARDLALAGSKRKPIVLVDDEEPEDTFLLSGGKGKEGEEGAENVDEDEHMDKRAKVSDDQGMMQVYCEEGLICFEISHSAVRRHPFFNARKVQSSTGIWVIRDPVLDDMKADDFALVHEFLEEGDYTPQLPPAVDGQGPRQFEGGDLKPDDRKAVIKSCAALIPIAKDLQLPELRRVVFRKVQTLALQHHDIATFLGFVRQVYAGADQEVKEFVQGYLAENYRAIMIAGPQAFSDLLDQDQELDLGVHTLLVANKVAV